MKAIVEQYAKGQFIIDRPEVVISERYFKINIEAGTVYSGEFTVESKNQYPIKGLVYETIPLCPESSTSDIPMTLPALKPARISEDI